MKITLNVDHHFLKHFDVSLPSLTILTGLNGTGKTQLLKAIKKGVVKVDNTILNTSTDIKFVNNTSLSENEKTTEDSSFSSTTSLEMLKMSVSHYKNAGLTLGSSNESLIMKICEASGKDINHLTDEDIEKYLPVEVGAYHGSVFYLNFLHLFKSYFEKLDKNEYNKFLSIQNGIKDIFYLEQEDFIKFNGQAPWDFANEILSQTNLNYEFKSPLGQNPKDDLELELKNNKTGKKVLFTDLSSGEKAIMSLVFALYNSRYEIEFPKVLLMDEPDASLHPSMIKYFLNVIEEIFVKEKKINVIITTHSPTTIALSNEESIYMMTENEEVIVKTTKDEALKLLTSGVPSFSVNYENRRQVFVESGNDVSYYGSFYNMFENRLNNEVSLNFIAAGDVQKNKHGSAINNCDTVIKVTEILRSAGNKFIYGIIDWDLKTTEPHEKAIKVLGWNKRYSIENYIFDPLLVAILLLRLGKIENSDLELASTEREKNIEDFEEDRLQTIANFILEKIVTKVDSTEGNLHVCTLINGKSINLPQWFLHIQGHRLEEIYIEIFPELNAIKKTKKNY
ncbi:AAA family ATPase [Chryseobacterium sp. c4a]|uniref:AAA family ATPase n=1 Tax=Chryseobacterium sp. c4a TaxID=1573582 RepID=UPI00135AC1C2|nr:ATP-binding protein [Chryseobacterium sp. c4a]